MPIIPVSEMHTRFLHLFDKQSNFTAPEITPEEIDIYLNIAQTHLLDHLSQEGIEKTQDWADMTKNITKSYSVVPFSNSTNKPNGSYVTLPADYRLALLEQVTVNFIGCNNVIETDRIPVTPVTRDKYNKAIYDPFNKPWKEEVLRLSNDNNRFELILAPGMTPVMYHLDYMSQPPTIQYGSQYSIPPPPPTDVDCALETKAAEQVIYIAVNKALQTLGDARLSYIQYDPLIKSI